MPIVDNSASVDRRAFVKTLSTAGLALGAMPALFSQAATPSRRRRYAIVGVGSRYRMYQTAIHTTHRDYAELVGLCDLNPGRVKLAVKRSAAAGFTVPGYAHTDFDRMIRETKPDIVIVTTMDSTHDDYIVRAMELGCDTVTEKPMTTTPEKTQRILDTKARTGKQVRVLFNYRYSPPRTQVKDILISGEIGEVLSVDFQWLLNTTHGASYFRRWHGEKINSGGLMVHKATHHFDLVNWWLGAVPVSVTATGKREFYTPAMAKRFGLKSHHERCHTCPEQDKCGFFHSLADNQVQREIYLDNEKYDGYFRDQCVFNPRIDIEDTMNVIVGYDNRATLSYSLNAFNSWEGYQIAFNGTLGRLEHRIVEQVYVNADDSSDLPGAIAEDGVRTVVIPLRGTPRRIEPWTGTGSHGGGDKLMLDDMFLPHPPIDKYQRAADERAGAHSVLIGAAANQCFVTGRPVDVTGMVSGLGRPDYAPMPSRTGQLPMPERADIRNT